ncbi:hypothetical protein [Novispirillum itersonii]|uniref:Uncharacterized protein n=1 Tax=Novispirillum itersonii TaxID=189 RepID=A0A7W9ZFB7_NOVIT|nr:hypothetical protein [Novispirillum itersonii]MBB6210370.1 hypothetical protein [Novispirillum itersonii]
MSERNNSNLFKISTIISTAVATIFSCIISSTFTYYLTWKIEEQKQLAEQYKSIHDDYRIQFNALILTLSSFNNDVLEKDVTDEIQKKKTIDDIRKTILSVHQLAIDKDPIISSPAALMRDELSELSKLVQAVKGRQDIKPVLVVGHNILEANASIEIAYKQKTLIKLW